MKTGNRNGKATSELLRPSKICVLLAFDHRPPRDLHTSSFSVSANAGVSMV